MARAISQEEFVDSASDLLQAVGKQPLFIQKEGETVAVLVSPAEYETIREARAERAIRAMMALREHMQTVATSEELEELERELDRKAS
jgi:PHD/YefM family antitoxin component YafN of YafNO toxin-antitoxin module